MLQTNYSKIEHGKTNPRLRTLQDLARALSLEVMLVPACRGMAILRFGAEFCSKTRRDEGAKP